MASKKSSKPKKKSGSRPKGPPKVPGDLKCTPPNICKYLEQLSDWLKYQFLPDYTALRKAVCNVEKQAFSPGSGVNAKPPRFCSGGPGNEPADPPKPPVW